MLSWDDVKSYDVLTCLCDEVETVLEQLQAGTAQRRELQPVLLGFAEALELLQGGGTPIAKTWFSFISVCSTWKTAQISSRCMLGT